MMEQPRLPVLKLDLQKKTTYNPAPLLLTQGDKGYIQPFVIINGLEQYAVTADVLGFRAMKPDGKYIEIQNEPARFSLADGVWNFNLPDELTQAIGTVTGAYFYVKSGSTIVASTTKFNYSISSAWSSDEESNNYVTKFEELGKKLQDYVNAGAQTITVLNDYGEEAKTSLSDKLVAFTSEVTTWKAKTTSDIDATLASKKAALDKLQTDFNVKYNQVSTLYANAQAEWATKKADYDKEFTANQTKNKQDFDAEIAKIETEKTAALDKVASDGAAKIANIQSQADTKLASIQEDWNTLKSSLNAEIQALADKVTATDSKADEIKTRLDALTKQLGSIDIVSVKAVADKATADIATLTKSITKKIDDIQVGGRNYIKNSDETVTINGDTDHYKIMYSSLTPEIWTYSAEVKYIRGQDTSARLAIYSADTVTIYNSASIPIKDGKISWTFKPNNADGTVLIMYASAGSWETTSGKTLEVINQKLEKGNVVTDWTPAPEDVQVQLTNIVSKLTKSVNGITPDASGNISLPQPDLSPYALKTQLPDLTPYVTNTALTANYALKSQVTTAETNAKSYADTKKSEAQSYTDSKLSGVLKSWTGTQAQYDAIAIKDPNVLYIIKEG